MRRRPLVCPTCRRVRPSAFNSGTPVWHRWLDTALIAAIFLVDLGLLVWRAV